jgi:hypothetical protein
MHILFRNFAMIATKDTVEILLDFRVVLYYFLGNLHHFPETIFAKKDGAQLFIFTMIEHYIFVKPYIYKRGRGCEVRLYFWNDILPLPFSRRWDLWTDGLCWMWLRILGPGVRFPAFYTTSAQEKNISLVCKISLYNLIISSGRWARGRGVGDIELIENFLDDFDIWFQYCCNLHVTST